MSEVEIEQALIALCHLHAELLLRQPIQPLIGKKLRPGNFLISHWKRSLTLLLNCSQAR